MRRSASLVIGALVLSGCAANTAPNDSTSGAAAKPSWTASSSAAGAAASSGTTPSAAEQPGQITLAFAGDVHFARQLAPLLEDSDEKWADRMPELAAADFAMVNLETALTEGGSPVDKKYTFRASPVALNKLSAAGIDAVSMANNHAADYGRAGIANTLTAIEGSPIPVVGFGKDETAAYAPATVDVKGVRVGLLAATEIYEETYVNHSAGPDKPGVAQNIRRDRFTQAARDAVAANDLVIAFMHWGTEGTTCPNERQVETARVLSEAGVDVVVGTHAHRPQGSGWMGRTFVGYGTGNHVWYNASPGSRRSGVLSLTVDANAVRDRGDQRTGDGPSVVTASTWTPMIIKGSGLPMVPESRGELDRAAEAANRCSDLSQTPN